MIGGSIEAIAKLVYENVPMINSPNILDNKVRIGPIRKDGYTPTTIAWYDVHKIESDKNTTLSINEEWIPYIHFDQPVPMHAQYDVTISFNIDPTDKERKPYNPNTLTPPPREQTLLYLAALNHNKIMFEALVGMGANPMVLNRNGSSILHGIAWGKVNERNQSIKTYEEKIKFMQDILVRYPQIIPLLFQRNTGGETYFDNLLMRHPETISKGLGYVAFPIGYVRHLGQRNGIDDSYYHNTTTNRTTWDRPY